MCLLLVGALATPVSAHAYLHESAPDDGEHLESVPEAVTLEFTGDGIEIAEVSITGPSGEAVGGDAQIDPEDNQRVTAALEDDGEGMYVVEWEVLADDGHTTSGTFFFVVGEHELDREQLLELYDDGDDDGVGSTLEVGANGLLLLSLVALVGVPVTMWVAVYPVFSRHRRALETADRRASVLLAGAGLTLFGGVIALGVARASAVGGELSMASIGAFFETGLGLLWLGQLAVSIVVAAVLVAVARSRLASDGRSQASSLPNRLSRRAWLAVAVCGGLAVQLSVGWTSHAASLVSRLEGTAVDVAHIAGAAFWLGGLVVLAVVVPVALRELPAGEQRVAATLAISRFSIVALAGVTLALLTGLLLTAWHVPDLAALRETVYGNALSIKTALVALALGVGGLVRFGLLRRLRSPETTRTSERTADANEGGETTTDTTDTTRDTDQRSIRSVIFAVRLEVALLVVVIILSAVLTATPTAALVAEETDNRVVLEGEETDVDVLVTVTPAIESVGAAFVDEGTPVVIDVVFEHQGERVPADDVTLLLRNDRYDTTLEVDLEETDDGTYTTVQALSDPEYWDVRVTGWVDGSQVSTWIEMFAIPADHEHGDHDHAHGVDSDGPFATWLRFGAVLVGLVGAVAIALETVRFEREHRTD